MSAACVKEANLYVQATPAPYAEQGYDDTKLFSFQEILAAAVRSGRPSLTFCTVLTEAATYGWVQNVLAATNAVCYQALSFKPISVPSI
ncbi:hypothetical protein O181_040027 [Austropuccinia psidii MF-1]|uniref:Uncharacterized protein n=1 Tax=Austropuccinia psidii MF-1 TaxID=1389203 RepID=A0A9Q3DHY8_9BASI|nr:hypothetical protein [Austropuccinia psidii MF-1]